MSWFPSHPYHPSMIGFDNMRLMLTQANVCMNDCALGTYVFFNYACYSSQDDLCFHVNQCTLFTHLMNTKTLSYWLIRMQTKKPKAITSHPCSCPKTVTWLCRSQSQAQSVLAVKERRGENSVSGERHVSVSDVLLCGGVVLSTLSLTSSPHPSGRDPLHLFTLLSDLKPRGQKTLPAPPSS